MLTLGNVTDDLEDLYNEFKALSAAMYDKLESLGSPHLLKADVDLLSLREQGAALYIKEGYFRLLFGNKVVRLYSENDFISAVQKIEGTSLSSEFAAEVVVFNWKEAISFIQSRGDLLEEWFSLMSLENRINLELCARLTDERLHPSLELRQFGDSDVIIQEGKESDEVYEMITGQGVVSVSGNEVGFVETGEIFGEAGVLVDSPRTASVTADGQCFVRVVKKEDFFKLLEVDRHLSASIAKTLAKRLTALNRRMAR